MNVIYQMTLKPGLDKLLKIKYAGVMELADIQDLKVKVVNSAKLLQTLTSLPFVLPIEEVLVQSGAKYRWICLCEFVLV